MKRLIKLIRLSKVLKRYGKKAAEIRQLLESGNIPINVRDSATGLDLIYGTLNSVSIKQIKNEIKEVLNIF